MQEQIQPGQPGYQEERAASARRVDKLPLPAQGTHVSYVDASGDVRAAEVAETPTHKDALKLYVYLLPGDTDFSPDEAKHTYHDVPYSDDKTTPHSWHHA